MNPVMYPSLPKDKKDKCLIGCIKSDGNSEDLWFNFWNESKMEEFGVVQLDPIELFDNSPIRENIKAILLDMFHFKHPDYPINHRYCQMVAEKLDSLKISYYFITHKFFTYLSPLIATNIRTKLGETLLFVILNDKAFLVAELCRTPLGYKLESERLVEYSSSKDPTLLRTEILGPCPTHKWIIAVDPSETHQAVMKHVKKNILKSKKLITLAPLGPSDLGKVVAEVVKRLDDPSQVDFHIIPKTLGHFAVMRKPKIILIHAIGDSETLPFSKSLVIPKTIQPLTVGYFYVSQPPLLFRLIFSLPRFIFDQTMWKYCP